MTDECEFCPDGHEAPERRPWAVYVDRVHLDHDEQPVSLIVCKTGGQHCAESDAEWLRQVIRDGKSDASLRAELAEARADIEYIEAERDRSDEAVERLLGVSEGLVRNFNTMLVSNSKAETERDGLRRQVEAAAIEALRDAAEQIEDGGLPGSHASGYYAGYEHGGYSCAERDAIAWLRREADRRARLFAAAGSVGGTE